jgi:hypothetical protein
LNALTEIQAKIQHTLEELEKLVIVESHIKNLDSKLSEGYTQLNQLSKQLDKELEDIEKLSYLGVQSLFHKVLGSKEEQLEKERQEFLEASMKYKEFKKSVELMEYEKDLLVKKVDLIPALRKTLEHQKKLREKEILADIHSSHANELREILNEMDRFGQLKTELEQAVLEGEKARKMLKLVISYLKKARNWGQWDMKGSRRGKRMKHRTIDKAMDNLSKAQFQLDKFSNELIDLGERNIGMTIKRVEFNKFTDFFFDNLISDWIVQQKIKSTLSSVDLQLDQVERILMKLRRELSSCEARFQELDDEKNRMLLS